MYADDDINNDDDAEPMILMGFGSLDDLIHFLEWVNTSFDNLEAFKHYLELQYEDHTYECSREHHKPDPESDRTFWNIVKNAFTKDVD